MTAPVLHIDFETRSALDLRAVGLHNYVRHPSTDVWCMAWAFGDGEVGLIRPEDFPYVMRAGRGAKFLEGEVYAHNAPFELAVWNNIMVPRYGWPPLKPEQTFCTMAMAYAMGLPGALEDAALALGLPVLKDSEGRALMLRMARPRSTDPLVWWDDAEKRARLYEYCRQDVRVERELHKRLMPLSAKERQVWLADYEINERGIKVDVASAKAAVAMTDTIKERCNDALGRLTGGAVQSANAVAALKEWLAGQGVAVESLAKQDVSDLLADEALPPAVRKALLLRQEASKASTAKLGALVSKAGADGRLRNTLQYHGAATGRWAGRGVQVHNLKRATISSDRVEKVFKLLRGG